MITLAALISGIVGSKSTQLPHIAANVPNGTKPESRVKRFARWVDNAHILEEVYFLPYADVLLRHLALQTLVLVMDGSGVGRGCTALMIHVVYKGRALPLAWRVRQAPKGHFPEDLHIAVVAVDQRGDPRGSQGGLSGRRRVRWDGAAGHAERGGLVLCVPHGHEHRGDVGRRDLSPRYFGGVSQARQTDRVTRRSTVTREAYGPIMVLCCWAKGYQEPLYLVSNMATAEEACRLYEKRFRIETFFSDQKSRGFHIHKSHISDVQRLSRLLIAACLAYIWIVYLGSVCEKEQWRPIIHRRKRCDLSLFQLGLRLLEHFLNEELPIPVQFHVTI